jgi:hypothetical protein
VATSDSTIHHWSLNNRILAGLEQRDNMEPLIRTHDIAIRGGPSIRTFTVLNDKRRIVTKDTDGNVAVYDVLKVGTGIVRIQCCTGTGYRYRTGTVSFSVPESP